MPYRSNTELPSSVKGTLPAPAQDIYRSAFNHAWQECRVEPTREANRREQTAHKVAWAAVRRRYEQVGDHWERKH